RVYNSAGTPLTGAILISRIGDGNLYPSVAVGNDGRFVVAWTHFYSFDDMDVQAQMFDGWGNKVGPIRWVASSGQDESAPSVAMDANGNFAVAYQYAYSPTDRDIYVRQYNSAGTYLRTVPVATSGQDELAPSIDMNAAG